MRVIPVHQRTSTALVLHFGGQIAPDVALRLFSSHGDERCVRTDAADGSSSVCGLLQQILATRPLSVLFVSHDQQAVRRLASHNVQLTERRVSAVS